MTRRWLRRRPGGREHALAAGVAVGAALGVGAVVFYLTRLLLAREEMEPIQDGELARSLPAPGGREASPPARRS